MPEVGPLEILSLGALALIVFGPQKLPELARSIGRTMATLRRMASDVKADLEAELAGAEAERIRPTVGDPAPGAHLADEPVADEPVADGDAAAAGGATLPAPGPGDEAEGEGRKT